MKILLFKNNLKKFITVKSFSKFSKCREFKNNIMAILFKF